MLRKLFRSGPAPSSVPSGQRVYAIGDVHGRADLLDRLIKSIDEDDQARSPAATTLVLLGDLIDRGFHSAETVNRAIDLAERRPDVRWLTGNHEETFLAALAGDTKAIRLFCRIGGRETALSYGVTPASYDAMDHAELAAALAALVPHEHQSFLASGTDVEVIGDYAFVHAGVRPDVGLNEQSVQDLRWIREPFLNHRGPLEKRIVHGHTISDAVEIRPHRIGIDTGAYRSGRLTALGLEDDRSWLIDTA